MEAELEEHSAVADAINEANSLAEKTTGSHNTRASGGARGGGASAASKRGKTSGSSEAGRGGGSAGSHRSSGSHGGQSASVTVRSKGSGGGAGAAAGAGAAVRVGVGAGGGSSANSKDAPPYTVARHVADFGNVVVGFTKTKAFRVANTGKLGPVSWSFNKNALAGSGYSIEPEKVVRLPEGASAAFSASFQARQERLYPVISFCAHFTAGVRYARREKRYSCTC